MPHFHFHVIDGTALFDESGTELADVGAARVEAVKLAGGMLSAGEAGDIWKGESWQIVVNDKPHPNEGTTFFTLTLSATEPPLAKVERERVITVGYDMLLRVLSAMRSAPDKK
jgi:hypothetical protein